MYNGAAWEKPGLGCSPVVSRWRQWNAGGVDLENWGGRTPGVVPSGGKQTQDYKGGSAEW